MLVQATGAPAFSAACSGGSAGSQWTPRKRRPVTFPATSEMSQRSGGTITSGWISLSRSKPAWSEIIGVSVNPTGDEDVDGDPGAVEVLRHDRAERLERRLGWAVGRGAGIQHRAEACRNVDD